MAALIGDGGHARDILATIPRPRRRFHSVRYHTMYAPVFGPAIIGINDPWLREAIADDLGIEDEPWIHPDAKLYVDVTYGYGTHVNYGVTMTRTTIGRHCTIAPGVTICGDVKIGDRCFIGAGAVISNLVTIGDDVTVGAGAVVLPNSSIPSGATVVGSPARELARR